MAWCLVKHRGSFTLLTFNYMKDFISGGGGNCYQETVVLVPSETNILSN
jgi:hypothetical protein